MEFDFDLPVITPDVAREIEVYKDGKCYGVYKVKHQFVGSPGWLIEYKRATSHLTKREKERIDDPQTADDIQKRREILISLFVDKYVTDSRDVPVKGGTWEHSKEGLAKFFSDPRAFFVYEELSEFSAEMANFRTKQVAETKKK